MNHYSPSYILSKSFHGFTRNGFMSFASVLILTSCLLITGCFGLLIYNLYVNLQALDGLNEIVCIVNYDVGEEEVSELEERIRSLENVSEVVFVSKEEALQSIEERYKNSPDKSFLELYRKDNPFPYAFKITYEDAEQVPSLTYELQNMKELKSVDDKIDLTQALENMRKTILYVFIGFLAILLFISVIIVMNTVKMAISARSKEITVMRYIGATKFFISLPFILESFIIGLISSVAAFGLQYAIYSYVFNKITTDADINNLIFVVPFSEIWYIILIAFVAIATLTCYVGSKIALVEHVKV